MSSDPTVSGSAGVPADALGIAARRSARSLLVLDVRQCSTPRTLDIGGLRVTIANPATPITHRVDVVWLAAPPRPHTPEQQRAVLHQGMQALDRDAVIGFDPTLHVGARTLADEFDAHDESARYGGGLVVLRRPERTTVHDLVFDARASIARIDARTLWHRLQRSEPPTVVDTRTHVDRARSGVINGSIHVPRTVLEWHLDPANGYRHPVVTSLDQSLVVVCNGGYSSSLAAHNLMLIGFTDVADLIGGVHAWVDAGFATAEPDHSHLDL